MEKYHVFTSFTHADSAIAHTLAAFLHFFKTPRQPECVLKKVKQSRERVCNSTISML